MIRFSTYEAFDFWKKKKVSDITKPEDLKDIAKRVNSDNYKNNYSLNVAKTGDDLVENKAEGFSYLDYEKYAVATNKYSYRSSSDFPDGEILLGDYMVFYSYWSKYSKHLNAYSDPRHEIKDKNVHLFNFTKEREQLINKAILNGYKIDGKVLIKGGKYNETSGIIKKFQIVVEDSGNKNPEEINFNILLVANIQFDEPQTDIKISSVWKKMNYLIPFNEENVPILNIQLDELEDYFLALIEEYDDDIEVKLIKSFDKDSNYHSVEFNFKVEPKLEHLTQIVDQIKKINLIFSKKGYKIELNEINRLKIKIYIRPIK